MTYISIDIDIDDHIDEIPTTLLKKEPKRRKEEDCDLDLFNPKTLVDKMKYEAFIEKIEVIPEADLEQFLNNYK